MRRQGHFFDLGEPEDGLALVHNDALRRGSR
jgi:hypothetical protein